VTELPWYKEIRSECSLFEAAHRAKVPILLKGPTGVGKTRLVEHMAARLKRPLITIACHDDTSAVDLVGRYLLQGGDTVWVDGPVTRAVRQGAILYLDEIAEARSDVIVVIHPLTDHRRQLFLERRNEALDAAEGFSLVVSYNPEYQRGLKELKPSTKQRFVSLDFHYPEPDVEEKIVLEETGISASNARKLVALAGKLRSLDTLGLVEAPSVRLLINCAKLMLQGVPARRACHAGLALPLSDDPDILQAIDDLIGLVF